MPTLQLLFSSRLAPWLNLAIQIIIVLIAVLILHHFLITFATRVARPHAISRALVRYTTRASRAVVIAIALQIILRDAPNTLEAIGILRHFNSLAIIVSLAWCSMRSITAIAHGIIEIYPIHITDNLQARRIRTQTGVLARCIKFLIILIGISAALTTFPGVSQVGSSLLASAGVAGVIIGFAAKPVLSNLLAGLQLAMTQPIRLGDAVFVHDEWGWIEEITGTYVVVRVWDERRLIVPLQWFIEHPFQNWTRETAHLIGSVFIWVDYRLPLEPLRVELQRICESAPEWDKRVCLIQVTETSERAIQLRALVSAADSPLCWDLRCRVRENLIAFIAKEYPYYLPHLRTELISPSSEPEPLKPTDSTALNNMPHRTLF